MRMPCGHAVRAVRQDACGVVESLSLSLHSMRTGLAFRKGWLWWMNHAHMRPDCLPQHSQ